MSTQSGITASSELLDAFRNLESALVVTISDDSTELVPDKEFSTTSNHFDALNAHFSAKYPQPGYIVVPREEKEFAFISFIPDSAPIRQKMLFASTKNTLIQQLGYSFGKRNILAFSELEELSQDHFHRVTKGDDGNLLTEEEKTLQDINTLQNLTLSQNASGSAFKRELPSMHKSSGTLFFEIASELDTVLRDELSEKVVIMAISDEKLVASDQKTGVLVNKLVASIQDLAAESSPFYALFGYGPKKVAFIYLCPSGSKVRERMLYAANKLGLLSHLKGDYGLQIDHVMEVGDADELDVLSLTADAVPEQLVSLLKFSKPKGPRRR